MKRMIAAFAAVAAVAWPAAVFTCAGVAHADDYTYVPLAANRDSLPGTERRQRRHDRVDSGLSEERGDGARHRPAGRQRAGRP
jgi:hypothetical protein